ncbi:hypothetical protein ACWC9Q_29905 [Streptomyces sp. NPDC001142]
MSRTRKAVGSVLLGLVAAVVLAAVPPTASHAVAEAQDIGWGVAAVEAGSPDGGEPSEQPTGPATPPITEGTNDIGWG